MVGVEVAHRKVEAEVARRKAGVVHRDWVDLEDFPLDIEIEKIVEAVVMS